MEQESKKLENIEKLVKENKETSDVDILVEFVEPIGFFKFLELEALIQKVLEDEET